MSDQCDFRLAWAMFGAAMANKQILKQLKPESFELLFGSTLLAQAIRAMQDGTDSVKAYKSQSDAPCCPPIDNVLQIIRPGEKLGDKENVLGAMSRIFDDWCSQEQAKKTISEMEDVITRLKLARKILDRTQLKAEMIKLAAQMERLAKE